MDEPDQQPDTENTIGEETLKPNDPQFIAINKNGVYKPVHADAHVPSLRVRSPGLFCNPYITSPISSVPASSVPRPPPRKIKQVIIKDTACPMHGACGVAAPPPPVVCQSLVLTEAPIGENANSTGEET